MARDRRPPLPAAQRFIYWLAFVAKQRRERAGVNIQTVAGIFQRGERTIDRFENLETVPDDVDRLIAAYARATGLGDPRELYMRAIREWMKHGAAPLLDGATELGADGLGAAEAADVGGLLDRERPAQTQPPNANTSDDEDDLDQRRQRNGA